jgi:meso-butanediol dehydrogenase / (S,S)-butanediol dehydrogenase / diacetyl reductase
LSVLVTGAASGIGAAISAAFVAAGHAVAVTDIDEEAAQVKAGELGALAARLDVLDVNSITTAADAAERELGPLDIWISNAGVSTMARFTDITEQDWDFNMDVNAKGVFLCGQEAARRLRRNGGGAIVNTASMAGKRGDAAFLAHYVASKFAVVGLTQAMATELAADRIRVNCICPGYVKTPMQEREVRWESKLRGITEDAVRGLYVADTPLGRLETAEDVAAAVLFLASPAAGFITGEALAVNGGAFME